jgi:hypothetical protein
VTKRQRIFILLKLAIHGSFMQPLDAEEQEAFGISLAKDEMLGGVNYSAIAALADLLSEPDGLK